MSSDASASTDSNTYYEDDFSSTEEDSSQGREGSFWSSGDRQQSATGRSPVASFSVLFAVFTCLVWILIFCALKGDILLRSNLNCGD